MMKCCLLDVTWPLCSETHCTFGYLHKPQTKPSQQYQPTFQQAALMGLSGFKNRGGVRLERWHTDFRALFFFQKIQVWFQAPSRWPISIHNPRLFFPQKETLEFGAWSVGWLFLVVNLTLSGMSYNPDKEWILMIWFLRQEDNVPLILNLEAG